MAFMEIDGIALHYQLEGRPDAPYLVLSNSLGTDLGMWAPQMPALLEQHRVLRYDTRGHGQSGVTPGPYSVAQLGADVIALMDHLGIAKAHFCGLSMGGMTGLWLGANRPERFLSLSLCNTSARIGTPASWNGRIDKVRAEGMAPIVPAVLDRWFTPAWLERAPAELDSVRAMLLRADADGYIANCGAVRDMDQREQLTGITVPTLVIAGTHDLATPPEDGKALAQAMPNARYVELDAAHLSNYEQADEFTAALTGFLQAL